MSDGVYVDLDSTPNGWRGHLSPECIHELMTVMLKGREKLEAARVRDSTILGGGNPICSGQWTSAPNSITIQAPNYGSFECYGGSVPLLGIGAVRADAVHRERRKFNNCEDVLHVAHQVSELI